ncbi:MAG: hypothetical protein GEU80_15765 [Dehalococcoidia bacterium]|nr:hypothetical protein [Dehalococcoidia bacterium]
MSLCEYDAARRPAGADPDVDGGNRGAMYRTSELASFAIDEFRRGLEGVTADEGVWRAEKADGTQMNAISWSVQHIGAHWHNVGLAVQGLPFENRNPPRDGTPPEYAAALALFDEATRDLGWLERADDAAMLRTPPELRSENVSHFLARATLHTWFHAGEVNAVRQLLGHPEIRFVGDLGGRLGWVPEDGIGD